MSGVEEAWHRGGCRWVQWAPFHMGCPLVRHAGSSPVPLQRHAPASHAFVPHLPETGICPASSASAVCRETRARKGLAVGVQPREGQQCGGAWESATTV